MNDKKGTLLDSFFFKDDYLGLELVRVSMSEINIILGLNFLLFLIKQHHDF